MFKKIILIFVLLFSTNSLMAANDQDVGVEKVFHKMMSAYKNENIKSFFNHVSKSRFQQDYLLFYDTVEEDFEVNNVLNIDTWIDKITKDGTKSFLYVKWEKRYFSIHTNQELMKEGSIRLLFDEINGKYKLIGLDGDLLWGVNKF